MWPLPAGAIDQLLAEDAAAGDLTTEALGIDDHPGRIIFHARRGMTVAGIENAAAMLRHCGVMVDIRVASGGLAAAGAMLLTGTGPAGGLHRGWKAAQTLVEILSGIATAARAMVDVVAAVDPAVRVACTRKTFPGGRRLSQEAVRAGGAILHRAGLSETVLVFPEHRVFLRGEPLEDLVHRLRRGAPEKKLVIEVGTVAEAAAAISAGFDVIQLEKVTTGQVATVAAMAKMAPLVPLVAVAGGVTVGNAADFVRSGAGLIVTSWPYAAPPAEVSVTIERIE